MHDSNFSYSANTTSNAPVLSRITPMAVRIRPTAITGQNMQYLRRTIAIARSCSARSARKRAVPSNVSAPMDSLTRGVFWTLRTHWRFTFAVPYKPCHRQLNFLNGVVVMMYSNSSKVGISLSWGSDGYKYE